MNEFKGRKYHYKELKVLDYQNWFDDKKQEKKVFTLSWEYQKYLKKKRMKELEDYCVALRHKLEYQEKIYGEVDEFDLMEYQNVLMKLGYMK
jgi:hypothetical protein